MVQCHVKDISGFNRKSGTKFIAPFDQITVLDEMVEREHSNESPTYDSKNVENVHHKHDATHSLSEF